mgnify:CR=1 FL=1
MTSEDEIEEFIDLDELEKDLSCACRAWDDNPWK